MGVRDDEFWAGFLGVDPSDWATSGVSVHEHAGLRGFRGFWCFRRNQRIVVSAPAAWVPRLAEIVRAVRASEDVMRSTFWSRALADDFERTIGAAFQGCLSRRISNPRPAKRSDQSTTTLMAPRFTNSERGAIPSGTCRTTPRLASRAYFDDGRIVAMTGYRNWSDDAGDPCVITRPDARCRGRGAAVTSAVVAEALAHGKLLLYQTLESNEPAVRIALSLGCERYATHLAVRLKRDAPDR